MPFTIRKSTHLTIDQFIRKCVSPTLMRNTNFQRSHFVNYASSELEKLFPSKLITDATRANLTESDKKYFKLLYLYFLSDTLYKDNAIT